MRRAQRISVTKGRSAVVTKLKVPQEAPTDWGKERERGGGEVVQGIEREYDSVCD